MMLLVRYLHIALLRNTLQHDLFVTVTGSSLSAPCCGTNMRTSKINRANWIWGKPAGSVGLGRPGSADFLTPIIAGVAKTRE
jgi:hypothetical protein